MSMEYYRKYEPLFGNWKIVDNIGAGSYGEVFKIEREEFGVKYEAALKAITIPKSQSEVQSVMLEGMDEKSASDYFRGFVEELSREFTLMDRLKGNSNIVSYEDHIVIEHTDDIGWDILIRMELLTPLNNHIAGHDMTEQDIVKLGIDICKALELCDKFNIIHRDIKPENIFISKFGEYKLGDFGIARVADKTTGASTKAGSGSYMAPEIIRGERYTNTVDIYSLGLVMYRLLNNNRFPFLPLAPEPITFSMREDAKEKLISGVAIPPPVNGRNQLHRIILRALSFEPGKRYQHAFLMRKELEEYAGIHREAGNIWKPVSDTTNMGSDNSDTGSALYDDYRTELGTGTVIDSSDKTESGSGTEYSMIEKKQGYSRNEQYDWDWDWDAGSGQSKRSAVRVTARGRAKEIAASGLNTYNRKKTPGKSRAWIWIVIGAAVLALSVGAFWFFNGALKATVNDTGSQMTNNSVNSDNTGNNAAPGTQADVKPVESDKTEEAEQMVIVPHLVGLTIEEASKILSGLHLTANITHSVSTVYDKDIVVSQDIPRDRKVPIRTVINIDVSSGLLVEVPNVIGRSIYWAEYELRARGLKMEWEIDPSTESGRTEDVAISQSIAPGERVSKDTIVKVVASYGTGKYLIRRPDDISGGCHLRLFIIDSVGYLQDSYEGPDLQLLSFDGGLENNVFYFYVPNYLFEEGCEICLEYVTESGYKRTKTLWSKDYDGKLNGWR